MKKIKLLLIEKNDFYKNVIEEVVATSFHEIEFVATAKDMLLAVDLVDRYDPQILIMDADLNRNDALNILPLMHDKGIRMVFISSNSKHVIESLKFSFVDFVFKPFDVIELIVAIDDAIAEIEDEFYNVKIEALMENINSKDEVDKLVVQGRIDTRIVSIHDIIEARSVEGGTYFIFFDNSGLFSPISLRRYELILRDHGFIRCNSRTLINSSRVEFIDEDRGFLYMGNNLYEKFDRRKGDILKQLIRESSHSDLNRLHA